MSADDPDTGTPDDEIGESSIPGHDEKTNSEIRDWLADNGDDLSDNEYETAYLYEQQNQDRVGALNAIRSARSDTRDVEEITVDEDELAAQHADQQEQAQIQADADTETDADTDADTDAETSRVASVSEETDGERDEQTAASSSRTPSDSGSDATETVRVRPAHGRGNYVAGEWFRDVTTWQTVERSRRVERALDNGDLEQYPATE